MYAWITWIWEKREAKEHLEKKKTKTKTKTTTTTTTTTKRRDWRHSDKSHVKHAVALKYPS